MSLNRKPKVFIGSSREAVPYAEAVAEQLEYCLLVSPSWAGTFEANDFTMEALDRELDANDFAVFIFAAEDLAIIRDKKYLVTRDNTLFEMGLFWGRLGRRRTFCLVPQVIPKASKDGPLEFHLPSDFDGLNLLRYTDNPKKSAAVATACGKILRAVRSEGVFQQRHELIANNENMMQRKDSVLNFLYEYLKNVTVQDEQERYSAFAEAIRNSMLSPDGYRTTGAALWKLIEGDRITQVGGNVGRGRTFHLSENEEKSPEEQIIVVEVYKTGEWQFFGRREIADVNVLCYPLGKEHVLSVHFKGNRRLSDEELEEIVRVNDDLLVTIRSLVGGDSR